MNQDQDWSYYDQQMAEVSDRQFIRHTFHEYPSLRSKHPQAGWFVSKPYKGDPFNDSEWTLLPGGWDHEHCSLCFEKVTEGMNYWANANEVTILCERCHNHYFGPRSEEAQGTSAG
jgi:hypothetical protein